MNRFVVLAPNPWDGPWMNRQQLFSRLARKHFVVYSTGALTFQGGRHGRRMRNSDPVCRPGEVLVDYPPRLLRRFPRCPTLDRLVLQRTARRWRHLSGPSDAGPLIAYVFHPKFWPYIEYLGADYLVYHAYDLFERQRGWCSKLADFQKMLCEQANLVIASSDEIATALKTQGGRRATVIPNGADYDAFARGDASSPEPADLRTIPRPRIGYVGALSRKLDFELIAELARRRPKWQFVLMGEQRGHDAYSRAALAKAQSEPNVHLLAVKPHEEVPNYVCRMDVNIMCYRLADDLWIEAGGGHPLKLHEYLASGRPVVSADFSSIHSFAHVVAIARGPEQWEHAIEVALTNSGPGSATARRKVAAANSWNVRVGELEKALAAIVPTVSNIESVSVPDEVRFL